MIEANIITAPPPDPHQPFSIETSWLRNCF